MKISYHGWIGENIALREETIQGEKITNLEDLIQLLRDRDFRTKGTFEVMEKIYIAINDTLVRDSPEEILLTQDDKISFFPAISGG